MLDLELNKDTGFMRASDVATRNKLPTRLTTLLVYKLKAANLIKLNPGLKGSYILTKSPDKIKVKDIFKAVGEDYKFKSKLKAISKPTSAMKQFFSLVLGSLKSSLSDYTLKDIITLYEESNGS
jgi:DNA-binding IscR family transcriptional regulator